MNTDISFAKTCHTIARSYIDAVGLKLQHLGIERYFIVLIVLDSSHQQMTQKDLCDLLSIDKVTMVRIIDYLTEHGFVERVTNPNDRRQQLIILSNKAKDSIADIKAAYHETNTEMFANVSEVDKTIFLQVLDTIQCNLLKR